MSGRYGRVKPAVSPVKKEEHIYNDSTSAGIYGSHFTDMQMLGDSQVLLYENWLFANICRSVGVIGYK